MKLIFIRHGDPDYKNNTVTQKGKREAELLANRVCKWNVTDFYTSPYGRARDTIKPALEKMGRFDQTEEWLREFDVKITEPLSKKKSSVPWDFFPRYFFAQKKLMSFDDWTKATVMKSGPVKERFEEVTSGFDKLLASYDYNRISKKVPVYNCLPHLSKEEADCDHHLQAVQKNLDEKNLVFTCHLGVMFVIIGYLTGISPTVLQQGFFVAPTSVTVLGAEERVPGEVIFRVQSLGDVRHLIDGGEVTSASGFYGDVSQF